MMDKYYNTGFSNLQQTYHSTACEGDMSPDVEGNCKSIE